MEKRESARIDLFIPKILKNEWKIEAIKRNMTLTDLIKEAMREKLEREKESK